MRTIVYTLAASAFALMLGAPGAFADPASDELAEMRAMVEKLQGQVEAQAEQIEHQGEVIRDARLEKAKQDDSRFGSSGIAAFLQRLEVEGWVAGSWFWNFNDPGETRIINGNSGASGAFYPFHRNYNNFQVDQVWFGLEHPVDEENRAGFRFDLVYGTTACTLGAGANRPLRCQFDHFLYDLGISGDNTSQYYVHQAYVQYLAPLTENGILIKAGKFATLVGAEVAQTTQNFNITRGNVYNLLQPIDHMGVLVSTDVGETGWSTAFGVLNGNMTMDPDNNESKSIIGQIAWAGETTGLSTSVIWGPPNIDDDKLDLGLVDLVLSWDPSDNLSTWINADFSWRDTNARDQYGWGVAAAARYAVTERAGVSGRFEYAGDDRGYFGFAGDTDIYSLTGTLDYALTSNLMVRGEVRWDVINQDDASDDDFFEDEFELKANQITAGAEIVYEF